MRPTFEECHRLLRYDFTTGIFTWKIDAGRHGRYKAGTVAGGLSTKGYWVIGVNGTQYEAHVLGWLMVTGQWPDGMVDHRDGNRSNNRFINLRLATRSQNASNSKLRTDNSSGYKGVYRHGNKWRAEIRVDGKLERIGSYNTPEEAADAYQERAQQYFGEFARV